MYNKCVRLSSVSTQRSFFARLTGDNKSEKFFKVFYERMKLAQQEIKATVTVNNSDLGSKKKEEEPPDKDAVARKKGTYYLYSRLNTDFPPTFNCTLTQELFILHFLQRVGESW